MDLFLRVNDAAEKFSTHDAIIYFDGKETALWTYKDLIQACSKVFECLQQSINHAEAMARKFIAISFSDQDVIHIALLLGILKNKSAFIFIPQSEILTSFSSNGCCFKLGVRYIFMQLPQDSTDHLDNCFLAIDKFYIFGKYIRLLKWNGETRIMDDLQMASLAYAIQTSGTTGKQKIVKVTQDSILPNIDDFTKLFCLNEHDSVLLSAPFTFDPSIVDIFITLTTGASLIILTNTIKANPALLLDTLFPSQDLRNVLRGHRLSVFQTTPSLFQRWSQSEILTRVLNDESELKVLALGGEECISLNILRSFKSIRNKTEVFNLYGLTEMSCWASYYKVSFDEIYDGGKIPLGSPLTNTYLKIDAEYEHVDSKGNKIGEVILGTQSRLCLVDGEMSYSTERKTGDLVKVAQGNFYFHCRKDRIVKFYGIKVNLQDIEDNMSICSSVSVCHCIYEPESSILFVLFSLKNDQNQCEMSNIRSHFHHTFGHLIPPFYRLIWVDEFPVNQNGKFNEEKMRETLVSNYKEKQGLQPLNGVLEQFKEIWLSHGLRTQGGFKDVGGSSLIAVEFTSILKDKTPRKDQFKLLNLLLLNGSFIQSLKLLKRLLSKHRKKKSPAKLKNFKCKYSPLYLRLQKHAFKKASFYLRARKVCNSEKVYLKVIYLRTTVMKRAFKKNRKICRDRRKSQKSQDFNAGVGRGLQFNSEYTAQCTTPQCADVNDIRISIVWKSDLLSCVDNSPAVLHSSRHSSHLVISSHHGLFSTFHSFSGELITSYNFKSDLVSSPCVSCSSSNLGHFSYIGCYDGRFCKINNLTGKIVWCFNSMSLIKSRAVQVGKTVYFASYDLYLYCLAEKTGHLKWKLFVGHKGIHANLLFIKRLGCICVCTLSGHIHMVDICRRRIKWTCEMVAPIFSSPCFFEKHGLLLVASIEGYCTCFEAEIGAKVWSLKLNEPVYADITTGPCTDVENIFICATQKGTAVCYEIAMDAPVQLWKINFGCNFFASPFIFPVCVKPVSSQKPFAIILVSTDGILRLLTLGEGIKFGEFALPGEVFSSPVAYFDRIFVGCRDNHVYCLKVGAD